MHYSYAVVINLQTMLWVLFLNSLVQDLYLVSSIVLVTNMHCLDS